MTARPHRKPASRRWNGRATVWLGVVIAAAIAAIFLRSQLAPTGPPASAPPAANPVDAMDGAAAYREGARLYAAGRFTEAALYFRRLGVVTPSAPREYHIQFVEVLYRAAQQRRADFAQPATRSSIERIALLREALEHLDRAQQLSVTPREVAEVHATRASLLRVWGFPWDGLRELRAAAAADPGWRDVAISGDLVLKRLSDPTKPLPGLED